MAIFEDLSERVDRLLLRNRELKRTTALIADQLLTVTADRDSLKSRLSAARARVDALLARLPADDLAPTASRAASIPVQAAETASAIETAADAQQPLQPLQQAAAADADSKSKAKVPDNSKQAGSA